MKAIVKHQVRLISISLFLFLLVASDWTKYSIFWGVSRVSGKCLGGVWGLSDVWGMSGYCLGRYDMQAIDKHPVRLISIS